MIFGQLLRVFKARMWLILTIMAVTIATTAVASFLISKRYLGQATMVVEMPASDPVSGTTVYQPGTVSGFLATQVDIIKSDRVVQRVIDRLKLDTNPTIVAEYGENPLAQLRPWLASRLVQELVVEPSREGSTISLSYEAKDARLAADITNAFAQSFVDVTLELKTEPARNYAAMFEQQAKIYRQQMAAAQEKVVKFQQQSGIIATDERLDVENTRLQELSTQLTQMQSLAAESRSRQNASGSGRDHLPEVVANPLIQSLKTELSRVEARYQDLASRLGSSHPQLIAAQGEMNALKSRLDAETARVAGSIATSSAVNNERLGQLKAAYEAQRTKVLSLKRQRDELAVLQREVDTPQKALDMLSSRATQTSIESRARLSNVSVVTPAQVPTKPSRPQPVLNIALGALFGLMLGVLAAISIESVQRPLRTSNDLLQAVGVPVLAVLPPASARRPQRLIGSTGPSVSPSLRLGNG
jgi:succinoglycan biosynthesis transport protein ExoP